MDPEAYMFFFMLWLRYKVHINRRQRPLFDGAPSMSRSPSPPVPVIKALCIGQEFDDFKSFKTAMQDWALSDPRKFTFRFKKSDRTRNTIVCVHADSTGCPFNVTATYSVARECVTAVAVEDEHNCTGVRPAERSSSSLQD